MWCTRDNLTAPVFVEVGNGERCAEPSIRLRFRRVYHAYQFPAKSREDVDAALIYLGIYVLIGSAYHKIRTPVSGYI